jgi:hypothetical protein
MIEEMGEEELKTMSVIISGALTVLKDEYSWSPEHEALDSEGHIISIESDNAVLFSLTGALVRSSMKNEVESRVNDCIELVARAAGTSGMMLDMWQERKQFREIRNLLEKLDERIRDKIALMKHPDNLPEILKGERESGLVFLPVSMIRTLWVLGDHKLKNIPTDQDVEEITKECVRWVQHLQKPWGITPGSTLSEVRPAPF